MPKSTCQTSDILTQVRLCLGRWCECVVCRWDVSTGRPQVLLKFKTYFYQSSAGRSVQSSFLAFFVLTVCAEDYIFLLLQATGLSTYPLWRAAAQSSTCLTLPPLWHSVTWCQGFSTTSASMLWKKTRRALLSSSSRKPLGSHAQVMLIFWVSVTEISVGS